MQKFDISMDSTDLEMLLEGTGAEEWGKSRGRVHEDAQDSDSRDHHQGIDLNLLFII